MRSLPAAVFVGFVGAVCAGCGSDGGSRDAGPGDAAEGDAQQSDAATTDGGCRRALGGGPSGPASNPAYAASVMLAYDRACDTAPLPSPNVTRGHPNEPAGYTLITERPFTTKASTDGDRGVLQPSGAYVGGSEGWDGVEFRMPNIQLRTDLTDAPQSGPNGFRFFYPFDMRSGVSPGVAQTLQNRWTSMGTNRQLREVYASMHIRLSRNWSGNESNTNKMPNFMGIRDANNNVFFSAEGKYSDPLELQWRMQGIADTRARIPTGHYVQRGVWEHWEWVVRCNSAPGAPDGVVEAWVNGRRVLDVRDVNYTLDSSPSAACYWSIFHMSPTFGGGGPFVPHDQWIDVDHVYLSGRM